MLWRKEEKELVVRGWVEGPRVLDIGTHLVFTFKGQKIEHINQAVAVPSRSWGWLAPEDMGPQFDRWKLHIPAVLGRETWWGEVKAPTNWGGAFHRRFGLNGAIIGEFTVRGKTKLWASPILRVGPPQLPEIEAGRVLLRKGAGWKFLGVLRHYYLDTYNPLLADPVELLVAWGNEAGEFLGWERVDDMEVVRLRDRLSGRVTGRLTDWDEFEGKLRQDLWGGEL